LEVCRTSRRAARRCSNAIAAQDFEGIVAKRVDAPYKAGRQPAWVKIKNRDYSRRAAVEWQGR